MGDEKTWRLWIDGEERTDECAAVDFGTPALVYEEWAETSGVRKMFGCLTSNRDHEPMWVTEPQLAEA